MGPKPGANPYEIEYPSVVPNYTSPFPAEPAARLPRPSRLPPCSPRCPSALGAPAPEKPKRDPDRGEGGGGSWCRRWRRQVHALRPPCRRAPPKFDIPKVELPKVEMPDMPAIPAIAPPVAIEQAAPAVDEKAAAEKAAAEKAAAAEAERAAAEKAAAEGCG